MGRLDKEALVLLTVALIICAWALSSSAKMPLLQEGMESRINQALLLRFAQEAKANYLQATGEEIGAIAAERLDEFKTGGDFNILFERTLEQNMNYFQNELGEPYLLETDGFYYLRYAQDLSRNKEIGVMIDGERVDLLRRAPEGVPVARSLLPVVEVGWHRLWNFFDADSSILKSTFYLPIALGLVSCAMMFTLGFVLFKSSVAGFFSAVLLAVHPYFFRQNMAGFADTTMLILPLSLVFFLGLALMIEKRECFFPACLMIASVILLKFTWGGWFYVLAVGIAYFVLDCARFMWKSNQAKPKLVGIITVVVSVCAILFWISGYLRKTLGKLQLIERIPGIQSTVKELARPGFDSFIEAAGGGAFFLVILVSFIYLSYRFCANLERKDGFLLAWFCVLLLPAMLILRFMFFFMPAAILVVCAALIVFHEWLSRNVKEMEIPFARVVCCLLLPGVLGFSMAQTSAPLASMTSAVAQAGSWIQNNSNSDAIIDTWWDYGYLWQYAAGRSTVLDAGPSRAAVWMAKAFMERDEAMAGRIFSFLNCVGHEGILKLEDAFGVKSHLLMDEWVVKGVAPDAVKSDENFREYVDCAPRQAFVVVNKDMVGSVGAIDSIATWNGTLGLLRERVQFMDEDEAIGFIRSQFGEGVDASQRYYDAKVHSVPDSSVAVSVIRTCDELNGSRVECLGYKVDLDLLDVSGGNLPSKIVVVRNGTREERNIGGFSREESLFIFESEKGHMGFLASARIADSLILRLFSAELIPGFELRYSVETPELIRVYELADR